VKMAYRSPATIKKVFAGVEPDRGFTTCWVELDGRGWGVVFGQLVMSDASLASFVEDLCAAFGVKKLEELVGKRTIAYWPFSKIGDEVEALEGPCGVFAINRWRKKQHPDDYAPLVERRRLEYLDRIKYLKRDIARAQADLERFNREFSPDVEWED
jgi:hypothetical protein